MRNFLVLAILGISLQACLSRPADDQQKTDLRQVLVSYYDALAKKDTTGLRRLTTENFLAFDDGELLDREKVSRLMEKHPAFKTPFRIDSLNVIVEDNNASAYYFRETIYPRAGSSAITLHFLESATFNEINGEWKLRFLHSTEQRQ